MTFKDFGFEKKTFKNQYRWKLNRTFDSVPFKLFVTQTVESKYSVIVPTEIGRMDGMQCLLTERSDEKFIMLTIMPILYFYGKYYIFLGQFFFILDL